MSARNNLDDQLTVARDAVADACRITRHVQRNLDEIRQHTKDDRSPVTVADYAAQALIAARLAAALGKPLLVGEEDATTLRADLNDSLREAVAVATREIWSDASTEEVLDAIDLGNHDATAGCYWTLDPIDGTKGFLRGGQYAISLALIEDGEVLLGVLGCPNMAEDLERPFDDPDPNGCLFYATSGGGSWILPADRADTEARPITSASGDDIGTMRLCESVEAAHSRLDESARIVRHLGARGKPARLDSQCKYAVVARGQADAYLRLPTRSDYVEKIWDHAAGKIVAEQAGAIVTDVRGNALDFAHGTGLSANRGVICATRAFHERILGAIAELELFT